MAIFCENTLQITGEARDVEIFLSVVKNNQYKFRLDGVFPLEYYVDLNEDEKEYLSEHDCQSMYESGLRQQMWGTSEIGESKINVISTTEILIEFHSDLAPPVKWVKYAANKYVNLSFLLSYQILLSRVQGKLFASGSSFNHTHFGDTPFPLSQINFKEAF